MPYSRILSSLAAQPWAMQPEYMRTMMGVLEFRIQNGQPLSADQVEARLNGRRERQVAESPGNIAVIPIRGAISNRINMLDDISQMGTSAEKIESQIREAYNRDEVKAIVLDVDSPGGAVGGVPELAATIREMRGGRKPIIAQVNDLCASAAYWIASAADEIVATPSSQIGSIGVFSVHEEVSKLLEAEGVTETIIKAGKYKAETNPFEPLSDEAAEYMQSTVDEYYGMFLGAVAEGRNTTSAAVRSGYGEGRTMIAEQARKAGMIDTVATMRDTLMRLGAKYDDKDENRTRAERPSRSIGVMRRRLELEAHKG